MSKTKKYIYLIAVFIILVVVIKSFFSFNERKNELYKKTENSLYKIFDEKLQAKEDVAISSSIILSINSNIKKALKNNDRKLAFKELESLDNIYKKYTKFHNIKIHIHTKDLYSFLRVWSPDKYGDYLGDFRPTIVWVKNNKKPLVSLEVGRSGLVIRGISPVIDDGEYLGSIEFIQGLNSISRDLLKENVYLVILMKKEYLNIAKFLSSNEIIDQYIVALKKDSFNHQFVEEIKKDIYKLDEKKYIITKNFFAIKIPLRDFESNIIGYAIIGESIKQLNRILK